MSGRRVAAQQGSSSATRVARIALTPTLPPQMRRCSTGFDAGASEPAQEAGTSSAPRELACAVGFIEIQLPDHMQRLESECNARDRGRPYAEIIDPYSSDPRFILQSAGAGGVYFDVVGHAAVLPGSVRVLRIRFQDPETHSEWVSKSATLRVVEFGNVGEQVKGEFEASMSARLNRPAVRLRGRFDVPRAADRYSP